MRRLVRLALAALVLVLLAAGWGFREAREMPLVRRATVELRDWPAGVRPMRVALISDIHIGNAVTDARRLSAIVDRIDLLRPDLVLLAGDFIAGHDPDRSTALAPRLSAPFSRLDAPLGAVAVLGNHDHWTTAGPVLRALARARIVVLDNAARRFGALTVVGIGDSYTGHHQIARAMAAARALPGPRLVLSHGPDIVPHLPADATLVAVGHTHCGQIVLPLWGPPVVPSRYGRRYLCGIVREGRRTTVITAGVGTSVVPFRYGAPPDIWLLTLGPPPAVRRP